MSQFYHPTDKRGRSLPCCTLARAILLVPLGLCCIQIVTAQSSGLDSFNPGTEGTTCNSLVIQHNGMILVGGLFATLGGQPRANLARLNVDGTLDMGFNSGANSGIFSLAVQADGKILVGGSFNSLGGSMRQYIARLNIDGSLDTSFNPGANKSVRTLAVQGDGRILVGGEFTTMAGQMRYCIARLNADGTLDASFNPGAGSAIRSLAVQPDGKILVGGFFTTLAGLPRNHIGRLNADGTLDLDFNPSADSHVYSLVVQADGKILTGGHFTTIGGQTRNRIARLNEDGTLDTNFNPDVDSVVDSLALQINGGVLVGGEFTMVDGRTRYRIARLNADGTLDTTFDPGAEGGVESLTVQANGKILAGGYFKMLGGQPRHGIARLNSIGPAIATLIYDGATITWLRDGTAPEVWRTTFEHTTNGSQWAMLGAGTRIPGGWQLGWVSPTLGTIRARGYASGGYGNASGGIVEDGIGSPAVNRQPSDCAGAAGATATFGVNVIGSAPFSYRWRREGEDLIDGGNIFGATTETVRVSGITGRDAGGYDVVVANGYGSVTSRMVGLTVNCLLKSDSSFGGSISRNPDLPAYPADSMVTITANPQAGYGFAHWTGDVSGSTNPLTVSMDTNKNITPVFVPVTITVASNGLGTVAKLPNRTLYSVGDLVTLTATAGRWYQFSGWADGNTNNPRIVTIDESNAGSYTANFVPTVPLETVTIGDVTRLAPTGMPAVLADGVFTVAESVATRGSVLITLSTTIPNGTLVYTLDGSEPSSETIYSGPFRVWKTSLLRTVAYNAIFSESVQGDPLSIIILPTLTGATAGGGSVVIEPASGAYFSNSVATVTANAAPGWSFLHWLGDASGSNPTLSLSMTRDKQARAVFGTSLNTFVVGGGSIVVDPLASSFPFASKVRLTAVPADGNTLAFWANAASGMTNNPLTFTVTNANPTVTAVFTSLGGAQTNSLTVIPNGAGQVTLTPSGNRFPRNTNVVLLAVPDVGQDFLGWSGATSGAQNPLVVTMLSNTVLTANFTARPQLQGEGHRELLIQEGFRLTLTGEWNAPYRIDRSTNLSDWTPLTTLTNVFGTVQFTDGAATNLPLRFYRAVTPP